jgi:transposase, IS5 family
MQPKARPPQCELFGARLSELLNPEHPLYVLAERIDWPEFDAAIEACYADELGRPGVNTRLMVGLLSLKHAFNESDESLVARWVENPYWQFFCGLSYMQHELPIDPSSLSRWPKRVGAERLEKLLETTIKTALAMKAMRPQELEKVNVDTTVQEKAIAFPPTPDCITRCAWRSSGGPNPWASGCDRTIVSRASKCWPSRAATLMPAS